MRLGDVELLSLSDAAFRLDGGAMFGVVPKPLWEKRAPADARNRISLCMRPLLVQAGGRRILIDAGIGDKMSEKEIDIYAVDRSSTIDKSLAAHGLTPNIPDEMKVDYVQPNVGHYGVFNGRRFREEIYPKIRDFTHRWDVREEPRDQKPKLSVVQ